MLPAQLQAFQGEEHQPFLWEAGRAAALLVHGFPGTPNELRPTAETLHAAGWTVRGALLPGFGPDVETLADRTESEWVAAVESELTTLRKQYDTVLLIGHSLGAALSIQVATRAPNPPDGLVLFAPFWKVDHYVWTTLPLLKHVFPNPRIFRWLRLDFDKPDVRDGIHNFMPDADLDDPEVREAILDFRVPVKMFAQIHRAGQIAHRVAPRLKRPTLVIQGRADELVKPHHTQQFIQRISGPVTYREVNAEHDLIDPSRSDWNAVTAALCDFVNQFMRESTT